MPSSVVVNGLNLEVLIKAKNPGVDKRWNIFSFKLDVNYFDIDRVQANLQFIGGDFDAIDDSIIADDVHPLIQIIANAPADINPGWSGNRIQV